MSASNCPETPRQKMISMMYLVYTALLALNVSTDVLNGFTMVQESLSQSLHSTLMKNRSLYLQFEDLKSQNPEKVAEWLDKANLVRQKTDSLDRVIEELKADIIGQADGEEGKAAYISAVQNGKEYTIEKRDNLDASAQIGMPASIPVLADTRAGQLKDGLSKYATFMTSLVRKDSARVKSIRENFDTSDRPEANGDRTTWESAHFEHMPVVASITLLTKIQSDLRNSESDVVGYLKNQVDASDFRVNKITAAVIPVSSYINRGGTYEARIILAALDSTKRPKITVNGKEMEGDLYTANCGSVGTFDISGTIELPRGDGTIQNYEFSSSYIVGEPTAIISADLMNVLYAGFANPVSVSVPGVPSQNIHVAVSNGSIVQKGSSWIITPTLGKDCNISVSAKMEGGKVQNIGSKPFRVKPLPDPIAFVDYQKDGAAAKYFGLGKPFPKANMIAAKGLRAELADADLDVRYVVTGFELSYYDSMGNNITEPSRGAAFTDKQKDIMRRMGRGKKFYIRNIHAVGPDNKDRILPLLEVLVN